MNTLSSQRGMGLTGVIVAAGVGMIIITALTSTIISQSKSISYLEDRIAKVDFDGFMRNVLASPGSCSNTFSGLSVATTQPITVFRDKNNREVFNLTSADDTLKSYDRFSIETMNLVNVDLPAGINQNGRMNFSLDIKRKEGESRLAPVNLELFVNTDSSGLISSCYYAGGGGGSGLVEGEMPCILQGYDKVGSRQLATAYYNGARDVVDNYRQSLKIFNHGEVNIKTYAIEMTHDYCLATIYTIFEETYSCSNKQLTQTSRRRLHDAVGEIKFGECGPPE